MQKAGNIDLMGLGEIQNAKLQGMNTNPETLSERLFWYDNTNHEPVFYDGTNVRPFGRVYTNFTGADGTNAGASGLVPAPAATDNTKFLCGDGTFKTPAGTTYTEGTGIDITGTTISVDTSVIAQQSDIPTDYVPNTRTVNSKALSSNITLSASDVGAVPTSRTVNSKALSSNITLSASDVGALADSTKYGATLDVSLNTTDYKLTITLKDQDGTALTTKTVDFPIESVVVGGAYDSTNKKIVLTLQNGNTIDVPVGDLVAGLQTEITSSNKLSADLISDGTTNKTVTQTEKNTWNGKQNTLSSSNKLNPAYVDTSSSYRFVTDTEKSTWNGKQNALGYTPCKKYTALNPALTVVNGVGTWTVTHSIGGDVQVQVFNVSTKKLVGVNDVTLTSDAVCTIELLASANITAGTYKVVVIG